MTQKGSHQKFKVTRPSKTKPSHVREGGMRVHKKGSSRVSRR